MVFSEVVSRYVDLFAGDAVAGMQYPPTTAYGPKYLLIRFFSEIFRNHFFLVLPLRRTNSFLADGKGVNATSGTILISKQKASFH